MTDRKPFTIAFLIYPEMTQLDFTGPAEVLGMMPDAKIVLVWKTLEPVRAENGIRFLPDATTNDDVRYDMICVPGGKASSDYMQDEAILSWLRFQAETAVYVTSVCTGSLLLAAAGLLKGYRAGSHWAWVHHLEKFGAIPSRDRVVLDGNRITAGGVTAGIDFGFRVIRERMGADAEALFRLGIEYDPEIVPGGVPETARPEILARIKAALAGLHASRTGRIDEAALAFAAE